jgi:hypothetical protein
MVFSLPFFKIILFVLFFILYNTIKSVFQYIFIPFVSDLYQFLLIDIFFICFFIIYFFNFFIILFLFLPLFLLFRLGFLWLNLSFLFLNYGKILSQRSFYSFKDVCQTVNALHNILRVLYRSVLNFYLLLLLFSY